MGLKKTGIWRHSDPKVNIAEKVQDLHVYTNKERGHNSDENMDKIRKVTIQFTWVHKINVMPSASDSTR